jgi:hypothetical protein
VQRALASVLLLLTLSYAAPAAAALFKAASVEEAARTSDAVVRGKVVGKASRFAPGSERIVTDIEVAVASTWKGTGARTVTVTVPGGMVGDRGQLVDAAPTFDVGEEVVLFLARRGPSWHVNGLALGKWTVAGASATPAVHADDLRNPQALRAGEALIAPMSVADLERRVRGAK